MGDFKSASALCPPKKAPPPPAGGAAAPDFDAVSKSIVGGNRRGAGGGGAGAASKKNDEEKREWTDDWLRIADPDQLDRIVPALEATIHRATGSDAITRNDITGLEFVKSQIEEVLILPQLHPQLFASALTRPARGLLLFGPPGTGKTLLARWIASECGATFFNVNASSVMSKWIGEAEKTVKALFQLANERQPSVIFVDEIDSLLTARQSGDNESSRRVKNEFLTSLEGADTSSESKVLLVGATNMPWELDPAALRRLPKRLYVPLPGKAARIGLLKRQLEKHNRSSGLQGELGDADLQSIASRTGGFSGSDLQSLLHEAAMGPVREASAAIIREGGLQRKRDADGSFVGGGGDSNATKPRNIQTQDFEMALRRVKPGFNKDEELKHKGFNDEHGTVRGEEAMKDGDDVDTS